MNEKALNEQRNDCLAQMEDIVSLAKSENRAITVEEQATFEDCKNQVENIDKTIKAEEVLNSMNTEMMTPVVDEVVNKADADIKAFADFCRGTVMNANMTKGDNGAVIPSTIANKIIDKVKELSPLYALATKYNIKGTLNIPYVDTTSDDITVAYATDFSATTAHANKFSAVSLTGFVYSALTEIAKSLLRNSDFDLVNIVIDRIAIKLAIFIEGELINGTSGKISGIARSYDSTNMKVTLSKKSSITADELIDIQMKVPSMYQRACGWVMAPATLNKIRKLKDGQGNYLVVRDFATNEGTYTLLGRPVYVSENAPALGTEGNLAVIYGDFSGLAVKEAGEYEIQVLNEVYASQGAIGVVLNGELDAKVENAQKIVCAACGSSDA